MSGRTGQLSRQFHRGWGSVAEFLTLCMIIFIVLGFFNWKSSTKTKCIKEYHSKVFSYFAMEVTKLLLKYYTSLMQVFKVLKVSCRYWWWSCTLAIYPFYMRSGFSTCLYSSWWNVMCVKKVKSFSEPWRGIGLMLKMYCRFPWC